MKNFSPGRFRETRLLSFVALCQATKVGGLSLVTLGDKLCIITFWQRASTKK